MLGCSWITPQPFGHFQEVSPGVGWPRVTRDSGEEQKGEMGKV